MNKIEITLAAIALLVTAGFTISSSATTKVKAANDCSITLGGTGTRDQTKCDGDPLIHCCYLVASPFTQKFGTYTP